MLNNSLLKDTKCGWVFALSDRSAWGAPHELIDDLGIRNMRKDVKEVEATAWGRIPKDKSILLGEGIAFYHTKRAHYGPTDPYKKKPRITMVGVIKEFEIIDPDEPSYRLLLSFEKEVVNHLIDHPIIRNDETRNMFKNCGMVQGSIRTWYQAPPNAWAEIVNRSNP